MPENNPQRVTFFALSADPERLHLLSILVLTAAATGDDVRVMLAGAALQKWAGPGWDQDATESGPSGLPRPTEALREARNLGARVVTCETLARLAGLEPSHVGELVDEVVPLASFWIETKRGRVVVL